MNNLSDIKTIIEDAKNGKMFILVDDEDRENEGDLVIPAEKADAAAVNFMAKYGRGLICLALCEERVKTLRLPLMSPKNGSRHQTAFTISIEASEGISTGISAHDRALTIATAINPANGADDICSPGHIFPLVARNGGVLTRAGHTEAAVDIARLAGLNPSGVICEIMKDDGTMARMPDLLEFAKEHNLNIATIADLIAYRRKSEKLINKIHEQQIKIDRFGEFKLIIYQNVNDESEHAALLKGDNIGLVRMHAVSPLGDLLGIAFNNPQAISINSALEKICENGSGALIILRDPSKNHLSDGLLANKHKSQAIRDYGTGAQILLDLGITDFQLITNSPRSVIGLEGYGINITGFVGI